MKNIKISIKKITERDLIFIQIIYNCFIKWGIFQFKLPSSVNYVADLITAILFAKIISYEIKCTNKVERTPIFYIIVLFFVYTLINWLMHLYSISYYLWGLRNTFRFYIFFVACTIFLEKEDIDRIFKILFFIFILNIFMTSYQYFILDKRGDFVAGFFGSTEAAGGNGPMLVLCSLICIIVVVQYMEKHNNILNPAITILGTLYIATLAEIKALYIMVVVIIILASLFTKFSIKKLSIVIIVLCAFPIALNILYKLYPNFKDFFNMETIIEYSASDSGYTGTDDINRFSAITYCLDNFLKGPLEKLFGMGLGAADGSSNFREVTTRFYEKNFDTHYTWFTVPHILIENGMVGLIIFWMIFFTAFQDTTKLRRKCYGKDKGNLIISQLITIIMVIFSIYNQTVRTEVVGYTCYALLSIPYLLSKEIKKSKRRSLNQ